jgi:hypothetical protein
LARFAESKGGGRGVPDGMTGGTAEANEEVPPATPLSCPVPAAGAGPAGAGADGLGEDEGVAPAAGAPDWPSGGGRSFSISAGRLLDDLSRGQDDRRPAVGSDGEVPADGRMSGMGGQVPHSALPPSPAATGGASRTPHPALRCWARSGRICGPPPSVGTESAAQTRP